MIVFLQEDRAYLNWVTHHRHGFVLDGRRRPRVRQLVLHRASCPSVKRNAGPRTHWTTGGRFKACSIDRDELQAWAGEESAADVSLCEACHPTAEVAHNETPPFHLTKLAADVLDYVLDVAIIHLEIEHPPYSLCGGDIAACFAKTPGQLSTAMQQLVRNELVTLHSKSAKETPFGPSVRVFPTPLGLRTLEAFRGNSDAELQAELQKLRME